MEKQPLNPAMDPEHQGDPNHPAHQEKTPPPNPPATPQGGKFDPNKAKDKNPPGRS